MLKNVISYETDVKQVLSKVGLGEADAGIVYTSDATGDSGANVSHIDIPVELQTIATYPIAATKASKILTGSAFIDSIFNSEGQAVLAKYGFLSSTPEKKRFSMKVEAPTVPEQAIPRATAQSRTLPVGWRAPRGLLLWLASPADAALLPAAARCAAPAGLAC